MYHGDIRLGDRLSPTVIGLLFAGGPFAVIGGVRPIIINALNRVIGAWSGTHISKEVFKRIKPPLANINSAPAVVAPIGLFGVSASSFDIAPRNPLRSNRGFSCHPVSGLGLAQSLNTKAAATNTCAISQSTSVNVSNGSAVTNARPKAASIAASNNPSSKAPACHFNKFWHDMKFTTIIGEL